MRLHINSGRHASSREKIQQRIDNVDQNITSPDVVFTEDSVNHPSLSKFVVSFCITPLLVGTMIIWTRIILPIVQFTTEKDKKIEEHIVEEYGANRIPTDAPALDLIREESKLWGMSNWISVFLVLFLGVNHGFLSQYLLIFTTLFGFGSCLFLAFLPGSQYSRNRHISERIQSYSDRYDEAVLVTGGEHHEGVADLLKDCDDVTVDNPKRE